MIARRSRIRFNLPDLVFTWVNGILLTIFLAVLLYPLLFVVIASFSGNATVMTMSLIPRSFTLTGYEAVFEYYFIWLGYRNSLLYMVAGTLASLIVTVMCAYPLSRSDFKGAKPIMALCVFTMYFSGGMVPSYLLLKNLGFIANPVAYVFIGAVSVYNIIITRTFMESNIPDTMVEAASIDGCNMTRFFFRICLPLSPAIIAILVLFYAVGQWNSWFSARQKWYPFA
jgi:ABC-type glycerol-3-phosphate transport system permease component